MSFDFTLQSAGLPSQNGQSDPFLFNTDSSTESASCASVTSSAASSSAFASVAVLTPQAQSAASRVNALSSATFSSPSTPVISSPFSSPFSSSPLSSSLLSPVISSSFLPLPDSESFPTSASSGSLSSPSASAITPVISPSQGHSPRTKKMKVMASPSRLGQSAASSPSRAPIPAAVLALSSDSSPMPLSSHSSSAVSSPSHSSPSGSARAPTVKKRFRTPTKEEVTEFTSANSPAKYHAAGTYNNKLSPYTGKAFTKKCKQEDNADQKGKPKTPFTLCTTPVHTLVRSMRKNGDFRVENTPQGQTYYVTHDGDNKFALHKHSDGTPRSTVYPVAGKGFHSTSAKRVSSLQQSFLAKKKQGKLPPNMTFEDFFERENNSSASLSASSAASVSSSMPRAVRVTSALLSAPAALAVSSSVSSSGISASLSASALSSTSASAASSASQSLPPQRRSKALACDLSAVFDQLDNSSATSSLTAFSAFMPASSPLFSLSPAPSLSPQRAAPSVLPIVIAPASEHFPAAELSASALSSQSSAAVQSPSLSSSARRVLANLSNTNPIISSDSSPAVSAQSSSFVSSSTDSSH